MGRHRVPITLAPSLAPNANATSTSVAEAFVQNLQTNDVSVWSDQVRSIIRTCRCLPDRQAHPHINASERRKQQIQAQITKLQEQLRGLDAA
jgi:hypothetical protein